MSREYRMKKRSIGGRNTGLVLRSRDIDVLRSLFESRIMVSAHVSVLYFDGRREAAKKRLQKLKNAKLVDDCRRHVSEPAVLFLSKKGLGVLESFGVLLNYPRYSLSSFEKRMRVSDQTIRHELDVMDVKASFHRSLLNRKELKIEEFCTWPALYEFTVVRREFGREIPVRPDAFLRIHEAEIDGGVSEHCLFLEVDRSTEVQDRLAKVSACCQEYYNSGGFAQWCGGTRDNPNEYPFRVLMILKTAERRNNLAERLLQSYPPILSRVWLSTIEEVKANPFGQIWIRPRDYRDATKGTRFDPDLERKSWAYRRQVEREILVEERIRKNCLFDSSNFNV